MNFFLVKGKAVLVSTQANINFNFISKFSPVASGGNYGNLVAKSVFPSLRSMVNAAKLVAI